MHCRKQHFIIYHKLLGAAHDERWAPACSHGRSRRSSQHQVKGKRRSDADFVKIPSIALPPFLSKVSSDHIHKRPKQVTCKGHRYLRQQKKGGGQINKVFQVNISSMCQLAYYKGWPQWKLSDQWKREAERRRWLSILIEHSMLPWCYSPSVW